MSLHTLLLAIEEDTSAQAHIDYAAQLAVSCEARLVGLSCHRPSPWPSAGAVAFIEGDPLTVELREAEDAALARERVFQQRCRLAGLAASEAIVENLDLATAVRRQALYADLVMMVQPPGAGPLHAERRRSAHEILQHSPRPVLMLPRDHACQQPEGRMIVAWDGSDGAARAAAAALPLLRRASIVYLVQVVQADHEDDAAFWPDLQRAAAWLGAHGVEVSARIPATDDPAAEALLSEIVNVGARLLVMGAWGHRRIVEQLLGGATRSMIERMTVPVLFAR